MSSKSAQRLTATMEQLFGLLFDLNRGVSDENRITDPLAKASRHAARMQRVRDGTWIRGRDLTMEDK